MGVHCVLCGLAPQSNKMEQSRAHNGMGATTEWGLLGETLQHCKRIVQQAITVTKALPVGP